MERLDKHFNVLANKKAVLSAVGSGRIILYHCGKNSL